LPVFQAGTPLVILTSGRRQASELEVSLVEHSVAVGCGDVGSAGPGQQDEVDHDSGGMPLTDRNARIQVAEPGPE